jgi:opacity protein-like surface antigen
MKKHPKVALYAGGGLLLVGYSQKSAFEPSADVNERATGYSAQGGLEYALSKWFTAAVEGQYRGVPGLAGIAGVSGGFDETDLGGFAIRGMVGIRFKK